MRQGSWPLSPLFWLAIIILIIQSLVFYAGAASRAEEDLAWATPVLISIGVVVFGVAVLLVWKWRAWIPAVLLVVGTALAYLGILGWIFGVLLVVTGIVVSVKQASPLGTIELRPIRWERDSDGTPIGPVAVLVGLALIVIGAEGLAAYVSARDLVFEASVGLNEDPFRATILATLAILLVIVAATYSIAYRAWVSGLCLLVAAGGLLLGFFVLIPTASFAILAIALSFVQPAEGSAGNVIDVSRPDQSL